MQWSSWQIGLWALMVQVGVAEHAPRAVVWADSVFGVSPAAAVEVLATAALASVVLMAGTRWIGAIAAVAVGIAGVVSLVWVLGGLGLVAAGAMHAAASVPRSRPTVVDV